MVKYLKHFYNKRKLGLAIAFSLISFFIAISLLFIVDNTDKLAKLLSESNKSKQTNSSKKTLI